MALQVFGLFGSLPPELRIIIWKEAAGKDSARIIDVVVRCRTPTYVPPMSRWPGSAAVRAIGGTRAYVRWTWTCVPGAGGLGVAQLGVNHEARHEYLRLNPEFLRIENGPRIYFKAERDVIFMDALSLFSLHLYTTAPDHLLPVPTFMANLQGFDSIRTLESSLARTNIAGLTPGTRYFAHQSILTGLIRPIMQRVIPPAASAPLVNTHTGVGVWATFAADRLGLPLMHHMRWRVVRRHFFQVLGTPGPPGILNDAVTFFI
ncbi:hypothetical protein BKA65DRAFT_544784 [Rhexocercosporidium sp. MPI-PUGE-AT-0058]|nr:hypothetical protein BKA65DRAFT_544784 [Rhexocercosporidium sp. MPI-PUGE-AT-0058]